MYLFELWSFKKHLLWHPEYQFAHLAVTFCLSVELYRSLYCLRKKSCGFPASTSPLHSAAWSAEINVHEILRPPPLFPQTIIWTIYTFLGASKTPSWWVHLFSCQYRIGGIFGLVILWFLLATIHISLLLKKIQSNGSSNETKLECGNGYLNLVSLFKCQRI